MRPQIYLFVVWLCFQGLGMAQVEAQLVVQFNLPALAGPVAISPDGKLAAIGRRIWDLESGMRLYDFRETKIKATICQKPDCSASVVSQFVAEAPLGFSPDGRYFVMTHHSCADSPGAAVWDLKTGKLITPLWSGSQGGPLSAKEFPFSANDVCQWKRQDHWQLTSAANTRESVFISADGNLQVRKVSRGNEEQLVVQRTSDAAEVWSRTLPAKWFGEPVFSADTRYLVYQYDQIVNGVYQFFTAVEDLRSGLEIAQFPLSETVHTEAVFSPKQHWLCVPTGRRALRVIDTTTWKPAAEFGLEYSERSVFAMQSVRFAIAPDESWILDATGVRHDLKTGQSRRVLKTATVTPVNSMALSKSQDWLATGMYGEADFVSGSGAAILWSLKTNVPPAELRTEQSIYSAAFTPDGNLITASEARDMDGKGHELHRGAVSMWNPSTQQVVRRFTGPCLLGDDLTASSRLLALSAGGKHLAAASQDILKFQQCEEPPCGFEDIEYIGLLHVWDPDSGAVQLSKRIEDGTINGLAISPKGQNVATADCTALRLWNLPQRRVTWDTKISCPATPDPGVLNGYAARIGQPVAFSKDGNYLAVANAMGLFSIWHLPAKDPIFTHNDATDQSPWISAMAFSANSGTLFVGTCDGRLKSFSTSPWEQSTEFQAHESCISDIAVDENGSWLATSGLDGTTRFWSLPRLEPLAMVLFDAIDHEWLVVAPDGAYEASNRGGELAGLRTGQHLEPVATDASKRKSGLLLQILKTSHP